MEKNRKKLFMITQPTVAGILMAKGYQPKKTPSPFDADKFVWLFPASIDFLKDAEAGYIECGKNVPGVLHRFLSDFDNIEEQNREGK